MLAVFFWSWIILSKLLSTMAALFLVNKNCEVLGMAQGPKGGVCQMPAADKTLFGSREPRIRRTCADRIRPPGPSQRGASESTPCHAGTCGARSPLGWDERSGHFSRATTTARTGGRGEGGMGGGRRQPSPRGLPLHPGPAPPPRWRARLVTAQSPSKVGALSSATPRRGEGNTSAPRSLLRRSPWGPKSAPSGRSQPRSPLPAAAPCAPTPLRAGPREPRRGLHSPARQPGRRTPPHTRFWGAQNSAGPKRRRAGRGRGCTTSDPRARADVTGSRRRVRLPGARVA